MSAHPALELGISRHRSVQAPLHKPRGNEAAYLKRLPASPAVSAPATGANSIPRPVNHRRHRGPLAAPPWPDHPLCAHPPSVPGGGAGSATRTDGGAISGRGCCRFGSNPRPAADGSQRTATVSPRLILLRVCRGITSIVAKQTSVGCILAPARSRSRIGTQAHVLELFFKRRAGALCCATPRRGREMLFDRENAKWLIDRLSLGTPPLPSW